MNDPRIDTNATISYTWRWEPSSERTIDPGYGRDRNLAVTQLTLVRSLDGRLSGQWYGVAPKKDGTWGKSQRRGYVYTQHANPEWLRELIDAMPTVVEVVLG